MSALLTLIAYDIADDRRRDKIHALLETYGVAVQQSLFEARLTARERDALLRVIDHWIDGNSDTLSVYTLTPGREGRIQTLGTPRPKIPDQRWFVV